MVRPSYRANLGGDNGGPFFGMVFDPVGEGQSDPSTCAAALARRAASSAGRPSSTSATGK
jgi:hypothetical protein